jgi:UDP-N-acetylglucosamine 2-epimerase (non-hydrolysing)
MEALARNEIKIDRIPFERAVTQAKIQQSPLYLIVLATKPCYIKLASLIFAFREQNIPHLLVDSGQHWETVLTYASKEFRYADLVSIKLGISGDLLGQAARMSEKCAALRQAFHDIEFEQPVVPLISGDTSTAGLFAQFWYLGYGCRSIHVEAGLRSMGPVSPKGWQAHDSLIDQGDWAWEDFRDDPFPEGTYTRIASLASQLWLAPVDLNRESLLSEGYPAKDIECVGSLSADAVSLIQKSLHPSQLFEIYPELQTGKWLRVDLHRRENMTPDRLHAVLGGLTRLAEDGHQIALIMSNALRGALKHHQLQSLLDRAKQAGVVVQDLWPQYLDVITFLTSPHCKAVYTDSGGLQEETHVLGVPCLTCRFSTDRPETVRIGRTNLLVPPIDETFVYRHLRDLLERDPLQVWPGLGKINLYGTEVGQRIASIVAEYRPAQTLMGAKAVFKS